MARRPCGTTLSVLCSPQRQTRIVACAANNRTEEIDHRAEHLPWSCGALVLTGIPERESRDLEAWLWQRSVSFWRAQPPPRSLDLTPPRDDGG